MTIKEELKAVQQDVSKLRGELGSLAGNVPQTDTRRTVSEQVRSFKAEREKLLGIEGRQPAVPLKENIASKKLITLATDRYGKPVAKSTARRVNPHTATAAELGVKYGMTDTAALQAIEKATSTTIPPKGEAAVDELRATANAIAHRNARVAGKLRQLAAELEEVAKA